jgi:UDP-glucose:(heptosyl)LPS alpha-1,3-glucosyltransferase
MKIALSIEHFEPRRGGGETYCRNFARMLMDRGHEVHVFAFTWDENEKGPVYHRLPTPPMKMFRRYAFAMRARERLEREEFDIIHGFGKSIYMDVFRPGGGVHRAWMEHEIRATDGIIPKLHARLRQALSLDQQLVLRLERRQFGPGGRHRIVAVSNLVKKEMLHWYHCEPERITVVHNGANLAKFTADIREKYRDETRRQLGLAQDEIMLLFMGHNYKRKGLHALIRALPMLKGKTRFRVVVVGKGRRAPCDRLAGALGVSDLIQYAGTTNEPERYYAAADIFCFPSYYDPCANVVLEALASGLPVITSTTNGSGEIITQGKEGYVVDPGDAEGMADCIRHLFSPAFRRGISIAARRLAESRPIERNFDEIMGVYEKVQAGRNAKAP